jgi:hypothetical protein
MKPDVGNTKLEIVYEIQRFGVVIYTTLTAKNLISKVTLHKVLLEKLLSRN